MNASTQMTYSEVYSILNLLGSEYIEKIPTKMFKMIEAERDVSYNPEFDINISNLVEEKKVKRETLAMIALLHLKYWCKNEEEKESLNKLFKENEVKRQTELEEKYNYDNLFKDKQLNDSIVQENVETSLTVIEQKGIFHRIIDKIKSFFARKNA